MNRRNFSKTLALGSFGIISSGSGILKDPYDRLAMSTVNFRERFHQTQTSDRYKPLLLTEVPAYFRERFGLRQVEFWSKHFESIEKSYLTELKKSLTKSKSRLINIQFDEDYQIGSPDALIREKSLDLTMRWMEAARFLGSGAFRVNPGNGELPHVLNSMKTINAACKKKGLILMVENHFGIEMDPDTHLRIVKETGANTYTLPDFGNYPEAQRYDNLRKIMPLAYQVSAKTMAFDQELNHVAFDFDQCMQISEDSGFKGIYSVEQWSREFVKENDEAIADWMIARIKTFI